MQTLHKRIKEARLAKGLSQQAIASLLGISQPGYQQIETGAKGDMKVSTLLKLCDVFEVSADWLLGLRD